MNLLEQNPKKMKRIYLENKEVCKPRIDMNFFKVTFLEDILHAHCNYRGPHRQPYAYIFILITMFILSKKENDLFHNKYIIYSYFTINIILKTMLIVIL